MNLINAYNPHSKSANLLADALKIPVNNKYIQLLKARQGDIIINWGGGGFFVEGMKDARVINKPEAVCNAVNKLLAFTLLKKENVSIPEYTSDRAVAKLWQQSGSTVVARARLEGKDGAGITLVKPGDEMPHAKMYTKFIPNTLEFRVNIAFDKTMGVQQKVPIPGKVHNHDIRTTGGGYGLKLLEESQIPFGLRPLAKQAIKTLGLDFGGVDMLLSTTTGKAYVLEVNTAPELTPSMVHAYAKEFKELLT